MIHLLLHEVIFMANVTIYLDPASMKKITKKARAAKRSISRWIREQLYQAIHDEWPPTYFEKLESFAPAKDLKRHRQLSTLHDAKREEW
jgi:hypothetical protein